MLHSSGGGCSSLFRTSQKTVSPIALRRTQTVSRASCRKIFCRRWRRYFASSVITRTRCRRLSLTIAAPSLEEARPLPPRRCIQGPPADIKQPADPFRPKKRGLRTGGRLSRLPQSQKWLPSSAILFRAYSRGIGTCRLSGAAAALRLERREKGTSCGVQLLLMNPKVRYEWRSACRERPPWRSGGGKSGLKSKDGPPFLIVQLCCTSLRRRLTLHHEEPCTCAALRSSPAFSVPRPEWRETCNFATLWQSDARSV